MQISHLLRKVGLKIALVMLSTVCLKRQNWSSMNILLDFIEYLKLVFSKDSWQMRKRIYLQESISYIFLAIIFSKKKKILFENQNLLKRKAASLGWK